MYILFLAHITAARNWLHWRISGYLSSIWIQME